MNYSEMLTDELTYIREVEYRYRNFNVTDEIRNILDDRGSFCIDTTDGQEVYHMGQDWAGKRKEFMKDFKNIRDRFIFK